MAQPALDPRSEKQILRERAMGEASDVLTNLEHAIKRARKGLKTLGDDPEERNVRLALEDALKSMTAARERLQKDAYFGGNDLRLI